MKLEEIIQLLRDGKEIEYYYSDYLEKDYPDITNSHWADFDFYSPIKYLLDKEYRIKSPAPVGENGEKE